MGEHTFTSVDGGERPLTVLVVDGWPGITIPTVEGPKWVSLVPVQVKKAPNKNGTWRWWQYWAVRDVPEVERALRGATVHIRHSYSAQRAPERAPGPSTVLAGHPRVPVPFRTE